MKLTKVQVIAVILFILGIIYLFNLGTKIATEDNDWWTNTFCFKENGILEEKYFYDVCIINGIEHRAKFEGTGNYYNLTSMGEIYEWQLVRNR